MKTLHYAMRFLLRAKSYTIINLLGLAFSLACCIILLRYIHRELTVDSHCIDRDHVYAVQNTFNGNRVLSIAEIGERDSTYIDNRAVITRSRVVLLENDYVNYRSNRYPIHAIVADSAYFQLFSYQVLQGTISLDNPESTLLMERFARKLFGKENPIGKVLHFSNGKELKVVGILAEPTNKRMFNFDMVLSSALPSEWDRMPLEFIRFTSEAEVIKANRIGSYPRPIRMNPHSGDSRKYTFSLIPLSKVYWDQDIVYKSGPDMLVSGNRSHLLVLGGICLLILFAGIINFINLYLVLMVKRSRVYGLRKVFGASNKVLFIQIFTENFLLVAAAMFIARFIVEITVIPISHLFDFQYTNTAFDWILSISILIALPLLVSIYAYVHCQRSMLVTSIRKVGTDNHSVRLRMLFLLMQYVITFLLVILSLYFNKQLHFMLKTDPGFRTENVIQTNMVYESKDFSTYTEEAIQQRKERVAEIDQLIKQCPDIQYWTTGLSSIIGFDYLSEFKNAAGEVVTMNMGYVTLDFFKVFDIPIIEGDLSGIDENSDKEIVVVNRAALAALGYTSCEGATLLDEQMSRFVPNLKAQSITAVMENYYDGHITAGIRPLVLMVSRQMRGDFYQMVCYPGRTQSVINYLKDIQKKVYGTEDFKYSLLKDDIAKIYKEDHQIALVYSIFACIAIIIACLGLFGISLFDIRQRYREIAIRKVNGALQKDLYLLLGSKYLAVLGGASIVAVLLSWYLIYEYTKDFVIKTPLSIDIFLLALLVVSLISLGTLFWQIHKAARIDPAKVMKTE